MNWVLAGVQYCDRELNAGPLGLTPSFKPCGEAVASRVRWLGDCGEAVHAGAGSPSPLSCLTLLSLQEEAKAAREEGVPDEEGWVKVTRKGRKPGLPRTEAASLRVLEREKQKRARKELLNFYAWQHRETKREREYPRLLLPLPLSLVSHCGPESVVFPSVEATSSCR